MGRSSRFRSSLLVVGTLLTGLTLTLSSVPASAQSLFDFFFGGGMRRAAAPSHSYADPSYDGRGGNRARSGGYVGGGGTAYCVRLCDGRYFPITNRTGNAADICKSFCPASPTKVFSGNAIDHAYASDGKRYSDIPNAFVYRARLIADCTCDGKSPTGLARIDANHDETLRQGDIVATNKGLMAYRGEGRNASAQFTPLNASSFSPAMRKQLTATRVTPDRTPEEIRGADEAAIVSRNIDQRNQAAR